MKFENLKLVKRQRIREGDIFIIDLDHNGSDPYKPSNDAFSNENSNFAYGRIIEIDQSSGVIVEIFNYVGNFIDDVSVLINNKRLFQPINVTSLCFKSARWKIMQTDKDFNKSEVNFEDIMFVMGIPPHIKIWRGGKVKELTNEDISTIEPYTILFPEDVENRIKNHFKMVN